MFDRSLVRLLLDRHRLSRLRQMIDRKVDDFVVGVEADPERSSLVEDPFVSMEDAGTAWNG